MLGRFEAANARPGLLDDGELTFVVAGGGPTGVELSGALAELITRVLTRTSSISTSAAPGSCSSR